jgi:hypothetical protein
MELSEQPLTVKKCCTIRALWRRVIELHNKRVDILVIDFDALDLRTIDAFKSS